MKRARSSAGIDAILAQVGGAFCKTRQRNLEWSLKVSKKAVIESDRFTCWLIGEGLEEEFVPILRFLEEDGAPSGVVKRQIDLSQRSVRQGIGISRKGNGFERRLYIHYADRPNQLPRYEALIWTGPQEFSVATYEFHFFPESPLGEKPQALAHPRSINTILEITKIKKIQQISGFWLRRREGRIDQIDISFPWQPQLRELSGILRKLCLDLGASTSWLGVYRNHPLRHLAFSTTTEEDLTFTAYFSSSADEKWPEDLKTLKKTVLKNGDLERRLIGEKIFSHLPELNSSRDYSLDEFYSTNDLNLWKRILGQEMHYHAGIFPARQLDGEISDELADRAARRAIEELYPYIPQGSRIYDIGCGWSGPLKMITKDLGCHGVGLTISKTQFLYGHQLGLLVRHGDAEATLPPGRFDCMILIESFCHIKEKINLLKVMRLYSDRLIMRVNCQDWRENSVNFGGTMPMIRSHQLREMIIGAGWKIVHWRDRRMESLPSVGVWHRRLQSIPPNNDRHMNILREYTKKVLTNPLAWAIRNPLIEVVAD